MSNNMYRVGYENVLAGQKIYLNEKGWWTEDREEAGHFDEYSREQYFRLLGANFAEIVLWED